MYCQVTAFGNDEDKSWNPFESGEVASFSDLAFDHWANDNQSDEKGFQIVDEKVEMRYRRKICCLPTWTFTWYNKYEVLLNL